MDDRWRYRRQGLVVGLLLAGTLAGGWAWRDGRHDREALMGAAERARVAEELGATLVD